MKRISIFIFAAFITVACKNSTESEPAVVTQDQETDFASYTSVGESVTGENVLTASEMSERFQALSEGDTIEGKFMAEVSSVCKKKGCWMNLELEDGEETVVKFKDYGFFVPKDIEDKKVVVDGKAFVSVVSVEEQRHLAEDGGKTPEEIAAITQPKRTLSFLADGVLIEP